MCAPRLRSATRFSLAGASSTPALNPRPDWNHGTTGSGVKTTEMRVTKIDWHGQPAHLSILRGITEQIVLLRRLEHVANDDLVTGLPNRALFYVRLEQAMKEALRHGHGVGLFFINLDGFNQVDDTHGRGNGALLLQHGGTIQGPVQHADAAMYGAKAHGTGRYHAYFGA